MLLFHYLGILSLKLSNFAPFESHKLKDMLLKGSIELSLSLNNLIKPNEFTSMQDREEVSSLVILFLHLVSLVCFSNDQSIDHLDSRSKLSHQGLVVDIYLVILLAELTFLRVEYFLLHTARATWLNQFGVKAAHNTE